MAEINQVPSKVLVQKAMKADRAKDHSSALLMYQDAVGALLSEIQQNQNKIQSRQLKDQVKEVLRRAEELKKHHKKKEQKTTNTSNNKKKPYELKKQKPQVATTKPATRGRWSESNNTNNKSHDVSLSEPNESTDSTWTAYEDDKKDKKGNQSDDKKLWSFCLGFNFGGLRKNRDTSVVGNSGEQEDNHTDEEGPVSPFRKVLYSF